MRAVLFGVLVSSPAVALWTFRGGDRKSAKPEATPVSDSMTTKSLVRVPVEVIAAGSAPEWVYIEVASQAIPSPRVADGSR